MIRLIFLGIALGSLALGLLTVFRSPDWLDWRFSVLAGQYGYVLVVVPLAVGLLSGFMSAGQRPLVGTTCALCAAAVFLLAQPCFQAWWLGRGLPGKFDAQFGPGASTVAPFSLQGLLRKWPAKSPKSTWTYSGTLKLDFYRAAGRTPSACVIVIHGGGWDSGERGEVPQLNDWLVQQGYSVADISYRLAPSAVWPAQRDDVKAAIAFVKGHSAEWGVDATRLVVLGRSAGGQIAEASAYSFRDKAIRGVIALYAPADMRFAWEWGREDDVLNSLQLLRNFLGGTPDSAPAAYESASGLFSVDADTPPTLLIHGAIDTLVWNRQSVRLSDRLTQYRVPNVLVSMPWATHALEYNLSGPSGQLTAYSVSRFLAAVCR